MNRRARGAALVETAFTLLFLLGFLCGGVQLGLYGYYTVLADYGAQANVRFTCCDQTNPPAVASYLRGMLGNLGQSRVAFDDAYFVNGIPPDLQGVDLNFADSRHRTGGFQFLAPLQAVGRARVANDLLRIGTVSATVEAAAIEPSNFVVCDVHCADIGSLTNQVSRGYQLSSGTQEYFQSYDNLPPYYQSFANLVTCGAAGSTDLSQAVWQEWDACPGGRVVKRGVGLGVYLNMTNSFYTRPGARLDPSYSGTQISPPRPDQAGPFYAAWCHRRIYMKIDAQSLAGQPDVPASAAESRAFLSTLFGRDAAGDPKPGSVIYTDARQFRDVPDDIDLGTWAGGLPASFYAIPGGYPTRSLLPSTAGWDGVVTQMNDDPNATVSNAISPWWGCGVR